MQIPVPALAVPALPPPAWLTKSTLLTLTHMPMCAKTRELAKYYDPILTTPTFRYVRQALEDNERGLPELYKAPAPQLMRAHHKHLQRFPYLLLEVLMCHRFKVPQFLQRDCKNADNRAHRAHLHDVLYPIKTAKLSKAERDFNNYKPQPAANLRFLVDSTPELEEDVRRLQRHLDLNDHHPIEFKEINIWHAL